MKNQLKVWQNKEKIRIAINCTNEAMADKIVGLIEAISLEMLRADLIDEWKEIPKVLTNMDSPQHHRQSMFPTDHRNRAVHICLTLFQEDK